MAKLIRGLFKKQQPPPPDTTPPSNPTFLAVSLVSNVPHLTWTASTDNVVVVGYQIWRKNGSGGTYAQINSSLVTMYDDHLVSIGNTYFYKIAAFDGAFPPNVSSFSNEVSQAISGADVTAPTTPAQPGVATVDNTANPPTYTTTLSLTTDPDPLDGSPVSGMQDYLIYHDYPAANTQQGAPIPHPPGAGAFASYAIGAAGAVVGADNGTALSASGTGIADPHLDTTDERFMRLAPVQGAATVFVRWTGITNTTGGAWPKVGPEARADLSASAAYIQLVDFGSTNGLKIEYRPSAGGHVSAGASLAHPGFPYSGRVVLGPTGLAQPQYSTDSTDGSNGTWTNLGAAIQMPFAASYFAGRSGYPNISGTGTGTVSGTYSHAGVTAATSIAYQGTGVPGVTLNLTYKGRDKAGNISAASPSRSITFAAAANTTPALWMANTWIGGDQINSYNGSTYQTYASKCRIVLLNWRPGWDSVSVSPNPMRDIMASIKVLATAAGRIPPKTGLYFDTVFIQPGALDAKTIAALMPTSGGCTRSTIPAASSRAMGISSETSPPAAKLIPQRD
jgi:hypothetical protein